jgi:hypothetical protein
MCANREEESLVGSHMGREGHLIHLCQCFHSIIHMHKHTQTNTHAQTPMHKLQMHSHQLHSTFPQHIKHMCSQSHSYATMHTHILINPSDIVKKMHHGPFYMASNQPPKSTAPEDGAIEQDP